MQSSSSQTSAMRKRPLQSAGIVLVATILPSCEAFGLPPSGIKQHSMRLSAKSSYQPLLSAKKTQSEVNPFAPVDSRQTNRASFSWTDEFLSSDSDYDLDNNAIEDFQKLQSSLGPEVVGEDLQKQIDAAVSTNPDAFLDQYNQDASMLEKVAMSSLPQQLPRPAITALASSQKSQNSKKLSNDSKLNFANGRVTPEQEIELAKKIQEGVKLHKVKTDFELEQKREITRQEWVQLANLKNNRELRKLIADYRNAKQVLVSSNMGLVHFVVRGLKKDQRQEEELVQEASLGLIRAAELFDPSRGIRFSTYATIWIKGMLSNSHVKETITVPRREKSKFSKIQQAQKELTETLGRVPTAEEIGKEAKLSPEVVNLTLRKMSQTKGILSLDYEYNARARGGFEEGGKEALLMNDKSLLCDIDLAERTEFQADVVATLANNLDAREERLMRLRYGLGDGRSRTIQECADAMGLSKTRAQQIAASCLKKLREASEASALEEYLLTIA